MFARNVIALSVAGLAGLAASSANAALISSAYDNLSSSWNGSTFVARASTGALNTVGNVERDDAASGNAVFNAGFVGNADPADVVVTLSSAATSDPFVRNGSGTIVWTDVNGSTISADISGEWIDAVSAVYFNGQLSNISFSGNSFVGNLGSISTSFGNIPLSGAITQLFLSPSGNFFTSNFDGVNAGFTAQIVPTPGALALVGLGGLAAGRRRR